MYKGRIFGKSVLEATFRSFYGTDLFLGELLVGRGRGARSPVPVPRDPGDVRLGLDRPVLGGAHGRRVHGRATRRARRTRSTIPSSACTRSRRASRSATSTRAASFRKPKSLPAQFAQVTAPTADDFDFLRERMGDLRVGLLRSGEDTIDLEVGIEGETLTSHVGVFATTGMGKSNLMKVLARADPRVAGPLRVPAVRPARRVPGGRQRHAPGPARPSVGGGAAAGCTRRAAAGAGATALRLSLAELTLGDLQTAYEWSHAQEDAIYRADARVRRRLDRARWREAPDACRAGRAARRGDEHDAGGPAPRAADPGHAVHLAATRRRPRSPSASSTS